MKLNQIITGIALAAGLLALAPVQSQAQGSPTIGLPIISFNVKVVGTYLNYSKTNSLKVVKFTYSNKDILKYAEAPKGSKLAFLSSYGTQLVIIHNGAIWKNLTTNGVMYINPSETSSKEILGKNGYKYISTGTIEIGYGSNGNDTSIGDNEYGFDITGSYLALGVFSSPVNKNYTVETLKLATSGLSGQAVDNDVETGDSGYMTAVGSADASGSVKQVGP